VTINVALAPKDAAEPIGGRNPAILYGLGNLVENAVDFARERVDVAAEWNGEDVGVTITDDGPGFAPEIMDRIGEPYVTSTRRRRLNLGGDAGGGLGLGFFIAKTLLERSGATLEFQNRTAPARGAIVRVQWRRGDFEQPAAT
jgi:two-component system, sensor histidine kinase RegB